VLLGVGMLVIGLVVRDVIRLGVRHPPVAGRPRAGRAVAAPVESLAGRSHLGRAPGLNRQSDCAPTAVEIATQEIGNRMTSNEQESAKWNVADWHGKMLIDRNGERIGKLQDVYVDIETDDPQFGTVKEGFIGRHLTFVPLGGIQIGPDDLQVAVTKEQVRSAPEIELHGDELSQADESTLYHHFELNYTPINTESGRRLARR